MIVPRVIVPVLVVLLAIAGLGGAKLMAIPSLEIEFSSAGAGASLSEVTLLVDGVKCVDTARQAASTLEELPGVTRFVAYASRNRVQLTSDSIQAMYWSRDSTSQRVAIHRKSSSNS